MASSQVLFEWKDLLSSMIMIHFLLLNLSVTTLSLPWIETLILCLLLPASQWSVQTGIMVDHTTQFLHTDGLVCTRSVCCSREVYCTPQAMVLYRRSVLLWATVTLTCLVDLIPVPTGNGMSTGHIRRFLHIFLNLYSPLQDGSCDYYLMEC